MKYMQERLNELQNELAAADVKLIDAEHDIIILQNRFSNSLRAFNKVMDEKRWQSYIEDHQRLTDVYNDAQRTIEDIKEEIEQIKNQEPIPYDYMTLEQIYGVLAAAEFYGFVEKVQPIEIAADGNAAEYCKFDVSGTLYEVNNLKLLKL